MGSFGRCRVWGFKKYGSRHRDGYWTGNRKRRIIYAVEEVNKIQEHGTSRATKARATSRNGIRLG